MTTVRVSAIRHRAFANSRSSWCSSTMFLPKPEARSPSISSRVPVLSRIRACDVPACELDDRLAAAKRRRPGDVHLMAERTQPGDHAVRHCRLDDHAHAALVPEAAPVLGLLDVHAEYQKINY